MSTPGGYKEVAAMEKTEDASVAEDSIAAISDDEVDAQKMPDEAKNNPQVPEKNPSAPAVPLARTPAPAVDLNKTITKEKASAVDRAKKEVQSMIATHEMDENDSSALQKVFKENEALKEKVRSQLHGTCCTLIHPISQSFAFVHFVLTGWEIEGTPGAFW